MNIIDRIMDHDISPYMYEYEGKMYYEPADDPYYIDYGYLIEKGSFSLPEVGICDIIYMSNEQDLTPRIHLFNKDGSFACCIGLESAMYYKSDYENSKLNQIQKEALIDLLKTNIAKEDAEISYYPIWLDALDGWYRNNMDEYDLSNKTIPNYLNLPD